MSHRVVAPSLDLLFLSRPPFVGGESAYYLCVNRNKWSIGVNFKVCVLALPHRIPVACRSPDPTSPRLTQPRSMPQRQAGVEVIKDLARQSDVLMENFLPGKSRRFLSPSCLEDLP